jgi:N-acetylglucosaminyldiphosphoundecaprenol N-acetyl-beta-D-mannosaminyltransferase
MATTQLNRSEVLRQDTQKHSRRTDLMGCPVDMLTSASLLQELSQVIDSQTGPKVIQFINANKIAQVRQDSDMARIMWKADYVLADGQPMLPMGRLLGVKLPERIDGIGLMGKLLKLADERRYSVYLLGAKQEVLDTCVAKIRQQYPNLRIAGSRNGYFSEKDTPGVVAQIREAKPDLLFLGMGSPMKERFADRYAPELGATVIQGVGGSFDVMADLVKRAPVWLQRIGMEWLFRVIQEPRRMFWRYTTTNATCLSVFGRAFVLRLAGRK